jgi:dihydrofolate reductase
VQHLSSIILIAAIGKNQELGRNNDLLWRLKSDMQFFKTLTSGHWVIMGRKSWESLPPRFRPLPNRTNAVVSRNADFRAEGAHVFSNLQSAIDEARTTQAEKIFIIGGAQIYRQALEENVVDEMYLTHVEGSFNDADVFFPKVENADWKIEEFGRFEKDESNEFSGKFYYYQKRNPRI